MWHFACVRTARERGGGRGEREGRGKGEREEKGKVCGRRVRGDREGLSSLFSVSFIYFTLSLSFFHLRVCLVFSPFFLIHQVYFSNIFFSMSLFYIVLSLSSVLFCLSGIPFFLKVTSYSVITDLAILCSSIYHFQIF